MTSIESEIRLFADEWVCYREIKAEEDTYWNTYKKLQRDIDRLGSWARKWGMRFQPVKCNILQLTRKRIKKIHASYTLEGTDLENVESIKYLGVTITSDMRWNTQVSNVCTKANRTLGLLRRNLYSRPQRDSRLRGTRLFSSVVFIFFQHACCTVRPDFRRLPIGIYIDKHVFIVP